jgi:hypothetical protein
MLSFILTRLRGQDGSAEVVVREFKGRTSLWILQLAKVGRSECVWLSQLALAESGGSPVT